MKQEDNKEQISKPASGLEATSIGKLAGKKSRNTTFIVFFSISLFLAIVLFLPDINKFLTDKESTSGPDVSSSSQIKLINNNNDFFPIFKESKINIDNNQFSEFSIDSENQLILFTVTNYNSTASSTSGHEWFVRLYDESKALVHFRPISEQVIKQNSDIELSVDIKGINADSIKYIKIGVVTEEEYPEVTLSVANDGAQYLSCINGNSKYSYFFLNSQITKIYEYFSANKIDNSYLYDILFETYQSKYNNYIGNSNFKPKFMNYTNNFVFETDIDLANGNYTSVDKNYLPKNTTPKKANFLMESREYNCQ